MFISRVILFAFKNWKSRVALWFRVRCVSTFIEDKRSVLRRQSRNTNRNIKGSVYCQYGLYSLTFRALALRQRENPNLSDEWPMLETLDYTIRIGSTPTLLYFDL